MGLLVDTVMRARVRANDLVRGLDAAGIDDHVHGCAIELHIGEIFVPGTKPGDLGSAGYPREELPHSLGEGETAVITTKETFALDAQHTALVFPVSSVSFKGLLMTNPGHVDPGFKGQLHVTVINMGRKPYSLERGARFLRALVFKLDGKVAKPGGRGKTISDELLETLSPDFLSVKSRGIQAAKAEVERSVRTNTLVTYVLTPLLAALFAGGAAWLAGKSADAKYGARLDDIEQEIRDVRASERLLKLETEMPLEARISEIERKLDGLATQSRVDSR